MVNDLDVIAVWIPEVAGPRTVAVRAGPRVDDDAMTFQERRPAIHIVR